jgi:predicted nuclease of predicted toxin-antitoxin system
VRFIIDAQLPPGLARHLLELGHQAEHVSDVDLTAASDRRIWDYAVSVGACVITKDEDFVTMRALSQRGGPPIVWVRVGNTTTRSLIAKFDSVFATVIEAVERGETVVQVPDV